VAYLAGDTSEAEFLKGARDNASLHGYEFMVGLVRLSEGDRDGAREHLEKMLATDQYYRFTYQLRRTLLERLKSKPTWPEWIPEKNCLPPPPRGYTPWTVDSRFPCFCSWRVSASFPADLRGRTTRRSRRRPAP